MSLALLTIKRKVHNSIAKIQIILFILRPISFSKDLLDSYEELRTTYREFSASSNKLELTPNCSLVVGNSKQKPIEYYVEKSSDIILYMKVFQIHLDEKVAAIELRNKDSCVVFSKAVTLSDGFQDTLDEFLLYSKYLMSSKKLNTTE